MKFVSTVSKKTKELISFFAGYRSSLSFEKLCENTSHIDAKLYATINFQLIILFLKANILLVNFIGKFHTYAAEHMISSSLSC